MRPHQALAVLWVIVSVGRFALADRWTYFFPEAVTHLSCSALLVSQADNHGIYYDKWEAEAKAKRNDPTMGDWAMSIAQYPGTQKGRHQAEAACSKWFDEASKRVEKAHK